VWEFSHCALDRFAVSFSHSDHDFAMSLFDSKIWINLWKKGVKRFACKIGFIYFSTIKMFSIFRNNFSPKVYSKEILQPLHDSNIDGSKFKNGSIIERMRTGFSFDSVNVKTAVTINVSGQVSKVKFVMHSIYSKTTLYTREIFNSTLNDLASGIRKDMRKSDLHGDMKREIRRGFPA